MHIEGVIFFSLKRRRERFWAQMGALKSRYVPDEVIYPMDAMDGADYETSRDVINAAVADGFPHFGALTDDWLAKGYTTGERGSLATTWSFLRAFRKVIELDKPSIVMVDNFFLSRNFGEFQQLFDDVESLEQLKIIQLHHWDSRFDSPINSEDYVRVPWYREHEGKHLTKGLAGTGDSVIFLTPAGAELLLHWCAERPYDLVETVIHHQAHQCIRDDCYAVIEGGYYKRGDEILLEPRERWANGVIYLANWTGKSDSERTLLK